MGKTKKMRGPARFWVATPFGHGVLEAKLEVPDVAEQVRALIRAKQAEQYSVSSVIIGGKYWKSLVAMMSIKVGKLMIPPSFDTLPILAIDADVIDVVYGNVEALHFNLGRSLRMNNG